MRNKSLILVSLLLIASMMLGACASATPQVIEKTVQVEVTKIVQGTPQTVQTVVTATPAPAATAAPIKSKDPTTLTYATYGEPDTLDPALDYENVGIGINQNVYETLIFYNKDKPTDFIPQLATEVPTQDNGGISADGMTYTFKIRQGVTFHNGDAMTPTDVAYSFQRGILQGGTSSPQWLMTNAFFGPSIDDISLLVDPKGGLYDDTAGMQKADPATLKAACQKVLDAIVADDSAGTVTMHLAQPWGAFLPSIANAWGSVMDKKWVADNGGWDGTCDTWQNFYGMTSENDPFTDKANGTGPFKLDHWTKGQEIVLTRNDNYWRTDPAWDGGPTGPAKLQTIIEKYVPEWGTRFAMLQAGDADIVDINNDAYTQVDPLVGEQCLWNNTNNAFDACASTKTPDQPLRLWKGQPTVTHTDVFFNFNVNTQGGNPYIGSGKLDGNGIPPDFFSDEHVRKAFEYCFDWGTYIHDALVGEGVQEVSLALPGMPGYDPNGPKYSYDPDKCKQEFQASTLKSPDGKSLWDTGFRMQIAFNTGNTTRQTVAEILASDIASVNSKFQVEIIGLPWASYLHAYQAKVLPAFIVGWIEDIHDPHNWYVPYLIGTYGSKQSLPADFTKQVSDLLVQGVSETDFAKRDAIYKQINQMVYDLAPDILLAVPTARHYEQRWVQGYYYNPIYANFYFYPWSKQ